MSYVSALEKLRDLGMHGMVISREGETVAEAVVRPYDLDRPHLAFSMTKSFASMAAGFCVQEGLLSLDDRAASFFPDHLPPQPCEKIMRITIRHLLMMATGHTKEPFFWPDEPEPLDAFFRSHAEAEPGSVFLYNTAGSHVLGYIIEKVSGLSLEDYLRPRLLDPLGMAGWIWDRHPDGTCMAGVGLHLKTRDIVKFGNFLLSEGAYGGKQLIGADWIREATAKHIVQPGEPGTERTSGYGYQFWRNLREGYRADGAFGQFCIVMPRRGMVVAMNSGTAADMMDIMDVVFGELLDALKAEKPGGLVTLDAPADECDAQRRLRRMLVEETHWTYKDIMRG